MAVGPLIVCIIHKGLVLLVALQAPCLLAGHAPAPLHTYMDQEELHYYFGTSQPRQPHQHSPFYLQVIISCHIFLVLKKVQS
jgi:hypothetical protein